MLGYTRVALPCRCCRQWGSLVADAAPELDDIAATLHSQLHEQATACPSTPPSSSGSAGQAQELQAHAAYTLAVAACTLHLVASALPAAGDGGGGSAAAVVKRIGDSVSAVQKRLTGNLGHLSLWGKQRQPSGAAPAGPETVEAAAGNADAGSGGGSAAPAAATAVQAQPQAGAARAAAAADGAPAPLLAFYGALDALVQHAFTMLTDQLKRQLAPLLANCMLKPAAEPEAEPIAPAAASSAYTLEEREALKASQLEGAPGHLVLLRPLLVSAHMGAQRHALLGCATPSGCLVCAPCSAATSLSH